MCAVMGASTRMCFIGGAVVAARHSNWAGNATSSGGTNALSGNLGSLSLPSDVAIVCYMCLFALR